MIRPFLFAALLAFAASAGAQERDRAYEELVAAQTSLQQAQAAREKGIEPLAGERLGIGSGHSRLAPEYWERQKRLDNDVESARKRLDAALARWNALR